jgi:hypothetical protein
LIIDADAPLAGAIAPQGFEVIGRRIAQIFDAHGNVEVLQAQQRAASDGWRQSPRSLRFEEHLRLLVGEAPYHRVIVNCLFTRGKFAGAAHG